MSNRWTCFDDIDENFYLRSRTFTGELKLANPLTNPNDFRQLVIPAISPGMRLKAMNFKASEDCLNLQYTVTHEEVTVTAPYPATSIRISHKVSHAQFMVEIDESLAITLKGDRNVDKKQLVRVAMLIADGKLRAKELNDGSFRLMRYELADECGTDQNNQVTVLLNTRRTPIEGDAFPNQQAAEKITENFGKLIDGFMIQGYDNALTRGNRSGEKPEFAGPISIVGAFASHLQSLCTQDHSLNRGIVGSEYPDVNLVNSIGPAQSLPSVTLTLYPQLPNLPDSTFNTSHSQGVYQSYEVDSVYSEKPLIFQAPVSSPASLSTILLNQTSSAGSGDSSVFIRLGPSQWERTIRIVAQRHAKPPRLPNPVPSFRDEDGVLNVLLSSKTLLNEPLRSLEGNTRDYVIRAEFVYGLSRAPNRLKTGIPDYDAPQSLSSSLGVQGPYSFTRATIFSSDHPIG